RKYLAKKGFDPAMGARPMQRIIQDKIRKALADELLFGRLVNGGRVDVGLADDGDSVTLGFDDEPTVSPPSAPPPAPKTASRSRKSKEPAEEASD
ncbi:MAG: ATP-dependent Clp protease ATP-binding subunit ClpA, partial [Pseudomonadota bacterium]